MDSSVFREITRASAGVGYTTSQIDRIAIALRVTRDPIMLEVIIDSILDLIEDGALKSICSSKPGVQPGCYIVPANYSVSYLPGYFATPWQTCEPFGFPELDTLD